MLQHFDSEAVIACAAPRPMLFMTGDSDSGSPVEGVRALTKSVAAVYSALDATPAFSSIIEPDTAHVYLPRMWERTLDWFQRHLQPTQP
jgi:fermentation-respiration switch protein FrsA (DUF1100 family)